MTNKTEARKLAHRLVKAGINNVRLVEHLDDGWMEIMVQRNNVTLGTADEVEDFIRRYGSFDK